MRSQSGPRTTAKSHRHSKFFEATMGGFSDSPLFSCFVLLFEQGRELEHVVLRSQGWRLRHHHVWHHVGCGFLASAQRVLLAVLAP